MSPQQRVLVLNAGSSSLKFKLFDAHHGKILGAAASGLIEQIGFPDRSALTAQSTHASKKHENIPVSDHQQALHLVLDYLSATFTPTVLQQVVAVGHRVVHGKHISKPALLNPSVVDAIRDATELAPLHNPPNLQGIQAAQQTFPGCPQVAVFDTAFHQTMPPAAYTYAIPADLAQRHGIRRYGFHGISYYYLVQQAAAMLGKPVDQVNLIACHLGAGSSVAAIRGGVSVDTSMGLTPLEGLCMATRSGDLDPAVVHYMVAHCGLDIDAVDTLLNKKSGLLGIAGTADLRVITQRAADGDPQAQLAMDVYVQRVRRYLGSYMVALDGSVDAVVFSAGIGENAADIRARILRGLQGLGIVLDAAQNDAMVGGKQGPVHTRDSRVQVLVIPTNEELSIAQQTLQTIAGAA